MSAIAGVLYDGLSSAHWAAWLTVEEGTVWLEWPEGSAEYLLDRVVISSRLGNTPRFLSLPDGRKFETADNDAIDAILRDQSHSSLHGWQAWLHRLESRWHYMLLALTVVIAFSWAMVVYGLPAAARGIAFQLPHSVLAGMSEQVLTLLDERYLSPSILPESTQRHLQQRFATMTTELDPGFAYRLLFRHGGNKLGANAFALPSGTVVMTDELVNLADSDEELEAVLAHELGHVLKRHGMRQTLQASALSILVTYATGDIGSTVAALPVLLVQLGYSRKFEREADDFAYDYLQQHHIAPQRFATILTRIEAEHRVRSEKAGEGNKVFEYLSTHPDTGERVRRFGG